jgi:hypothetical protein
MSNKRKAAWLIWLIPILSILIISAFFALTRYLIGTETKQDVDYFQTPFVPGESPQSAVGSDSR